jgi:hypothetical protein
MSKISDAIRHTQNEDGGIVLNTLSGRMFCLNPVGSRIFELLVQGCDEAFIAEDIALGCGVSTEAVRTDLHEFIETLKEHEILGSPALGKLHKGFDGRGAIDEIG